MIYDTPVSGLIRYWGVGRLDSQWVRGLGDARQHHADGRALADRALQRDVPAVLLDDGPGPSQANTRARDTQGRTGAIEVREDVLHFVCRNTHALITHGNAYPLLVLC